MAGFSPRDRRPGEFGGVPGPFGNVDEGAPLSPELEQRALYQSPGGRDVYIAFDGSNDASKLTPPSHGQGGVRQGTESFS